MENKKSIHKPYQDKIKLDSSSKLDFVCSNCDSEIPSKNININNSLAKCDNCNSVFTLKDKILFENKSIGRPEVLLPIGTDVLTLNNSLDIRIDWLKSQSKGALIFLTIFAAIWNTIIFIIASSLLSQSGTFAGIGFMSLHIAVGVGLLYYLAGAYFNYTDVIVTDSYIQIEQRPIKNPFRPKKTYRSENIDQIYVTKYVSSTTNNVPNYAYALHAVLKDTSSPITLVKGMNKETQLYLEQEIERFLKIKDRKISKSIRS